MHTTAHSTLPTVWTGKNVPQKFQALHQGIYEHYQDVGKADLGHKLLQRPCLPKLCSDYSVVEDLRNDLRGVDGFHLSPLFRNFELYVRNQRKIYQQGEVKKLYQMYQRSGGQCRLRKEDQNWDAVIQELRRGNKLVSGGMAVRSDYFGEIDPLGLNDGIEAFAEGSGQIRFTAALSVATGKYAWNIGKLLKAAKLQEINPKNLAWKTFTVCWRRLRAIELDQGAFVKGIAGYKRFASMYADGDMHKAYMIASALLGDEFEDLGWGEVILLKVWQLPQYERYFYERMKQGELEGRKAAEEFLEWSGLPPLAAWRVASVLLKRIGLSTESLGWPPRSKFCSYSERDG